ncbi:MAG: glycosyl hydrolase [Chloroflexi bacterium]|nr:MAG: glycosyl hydrolase [Chloroflexota bacterium]
MNREVSAGDTVLLVGTKRGLFLLSSGDRETWTCESPSLGGRRIYSAVLDQRAGTRIFAAENGDFFGTFLRYSDDLGSTWHEPAQGIAFSPESGRSLTNIWTIVPGRPEHPGVVYAGVDPASLWMSSDGGETWAINTGLESHPTRSTWEPGAGGLCLHTIIPDYSNPSRMWIGISAVGCMRTDDGGDGWTFANRNTRAGFQPNIYPEYGQCVHRIIQHPTSPDTLYQQNHCGIYKSVNAGEDWMDIQHNLPSEFGFPIALDARHPDTIYTVVEDGEARRNVGEHFSVYRTKNGGEEWESLTTGLPSGPEVVLGVLRHGLCTDASDPCGVYLGTNTGQLFASSDGGDHWRLIADFLPSIYSVSVATVR